MITPVIRREFTVYLDVVTRLGPINDAETESRWSFCDKGCFLFPGMSVIEFARSEQRLLEGLLNDPLALDALLKGDALCFAAYACELDELPTARPHLQILAPVIARMPHPDRAFLQDALDRDELYECAGPLQCATETSVTSMSAIVMPPPDRWVPNAAAVAERRYRVAIGVRSGLSPVSKRYLREVLTELKRTTTLSVSPEVYAQIQERLRETLIADEAVLRAWLERDALRAIADCGAEKFLEGGEMEALAPVIAALDEPERAHFEHAMAQDALYDCASGLFEASDQELEAVRFAFGG